MAPQDSFTLRPIVASPVAVPADLAERDLPTEKATHSLVESRGQRQLWRTVIDRTDAGLPEHVRLHIVRDGQCEFFLMAERRGLEAWSTLDSQAFPLRAPHEKRSPIRAN